MERALMLVKDDVVITEAAAKLAQLEEDVISTMSFIEKQAKDLEASTKIKVKEQWITIEKRLAELGLIDQYTSPSIALRADKTVVVIREDDSDKDSKKEERSIRLNPESSKHRDLLRMLKTILDD